MNHSIKVPMKTILLFFLLLSVSHSQELSWEELENVALVCVYQTEVEQKPRQLRKLTWIATVVGVGRGNLKLGEKIVFTIFTDDLKARPTALPGDLRYVSFGTDQRSGNHVQLQAGDMNRFSKENTKLFESIKKPKKAKGSKP